MPKKKLKTKKDKTIFGLLACGWVENEGTSKYRSFVRGDRRMLVGKSGAMRSLAVGAPIQSSISCTDSRNQNSYIFLSENRELVEDDEEAAKDLHTAYLKVSDSNTAAMILDQFKSEQDDSSDNSDKQIISRGGVAISARSILMQEGGIEFGVKHSAIIHARCPLQPTWDYYDVTIIPMSFLDVRDLECILDEVRGKEMTQEDIAVALAAVLPNCTIQITGKHTANTNTTVTVRATK